MTLARVKFVRTADAANARAGRRRPRSIVASREAPARTARADLPSHHFISKRLSRSFPQNLIFRFLQTKARIQIWLFENVDVVMEGRIIVRPDSCFRNNPPPRSCLARRAPVRASFQTPLSPLG